MHAESIRLALQMGEGFEEMGVFEIGNGRKSAVGIRRGNGAVGVGRKSVETVVVIDVVVASWTNGEN